MTQTVESLRAQFAHPALKFEREPGGLVSIFAQTSAARLKAYLNGAHVAGYTPAGGEPVLWMSQKSFHEPGKPLRGGVPICFPWFGPHPTDPTQPAHGTARISEWTLEEATIDDDGQIALAFSLEIGDFDLLYEVDAGAELELRLHVTNLADAVASYDLALHSYLSVSDVRNAKIDGLAGRGYIDKMRAAGEFVQGDEPISIAGETDRIYVDSIQSVGVTDPALARRIVVDKDGSRSTVVWNPWIDKAKKMPDFGDDEWPQMLCIETANAGPNRVTIEGGQTITTEALIRVEKR